MLPFDRSTISRIVLFLLLTAPAAFGQETNRGSQTKPSSTVKAVLTGYGTTGYAAVFGDSLQNNFRASFTPVTLFQLRNDLLFEAEVDFFLHDGATDLSLEHAQIHYLGFERAQITAGKFHLPFGIWMHPSWINKMPTPPLLYGHAHGGVTETALLPILFDVGIMAKTKQTLGNYWALGTTVWVSQGPSLVAETHGSEAHEDGDHSHNAEPSNPSNGTEVKLPQVAYGVALPDNNTNKMIGARLRLMAGPNVAVHLTGFHALYDSKNQLGLNGGNLSLVWQARPLNIRAEAILLHQEFRRSEELDVLGEENRPIESANYGGYYLQGSWRKGNLEPVVRWSHLLERQWQTVHLRAARRQLALGFNYWMAPSVPLKLAFQWGLDDSNAVLVEWAFGF